MTTDWRKIEGWLSVAEGVKLAELASGNVVVEIGSYKGRSTMAMASTASVVYSVDTFRGENECGGSDTLDEFRRNTRGAENVVAIVANHAGGLDMLGSGIADLVFIDGAHDSDSVERDTRTAARLLKPGGIVVYHDAHYDTVREAWSRVGFTPDGECESIAWGQLDDLKCDHVGTRHDWIWEDDDGEEGE